MPATYKDIQRITGFSLSTISRYYNGQKLKPATRKAIEEAGSRLDFRINDYARGLRSRKALSVGLLIPDLNSMFCTTIMYSIGRLLRHSGYSCLVCDCDSDKQVEINAMNFLIKKSVDGIITIPLDTDGAQLEPTRARNIPTVLIDRVVPSFETDAVLIDNFESGKMASEYLLSRGHKKAAIISGYSKFQTMTDRQNGFISLFPKSDPRFSVRLIETDWTVEGGYQAAKELLTNPGEITVLFCANYELTLGAVIAMNELGVRFPDDISVIGFDNMQLTGLIRPAITLIAQPMELIAGRATELLLKRLNSGTAGEYETAVLKPSLVNGASVADLS